MQNIKTNLVVSVITAIVFFVVPVSTQSQQRSPKISAPKLDVGEFDWPQWGGTSLRNNTPVGRNIPVTWDITTGKNIKWKANLGSVTHSTPVVANGKVFVGTNNAAGRIARFPWDNWKQTDLGCLVCFDEETGKFLWQYSAKKLKTGRLNDWPMTGICASPLVDGDRLWIVSNRCEVVCLDIDGFRDGKNDGPFKKEENTDANEADVIWKLDMIGELKVHPHNMSTCSVTSDGKRLFVSTSNGVDGTHANIPSPEAPSFLCLDRDTGDVLWSDNSPGEFILHGQWASPTYFETGKQPQVLFPGGDGWLYSFDPRGDGNGNSKLLWKFDCNPKETKWILGGRGRRNNLCGSACFYKNRVFIAVGQDPEHGEGEGHLWCIDPVKKLDGSDVSPKLAIDKTSKPLPRRRLQAVNPKNGEQAIHNPDSALVWHFTGVDMNGNGKMTFEETMHRTFTTPAIKDDILYIADFAGAVHCLDAKTGWQYWSYDLFGACWSSPLIVDGKVYIGDEDGDVAIFPHTSDPKKALTEAPNRRFVKWEPALGEPSVENIIYSTPVVANNTLFIASKNTLYAIAAHKK